MPSRTDIRDVSDLEDRVLAQKWFYRYTLPSGRVTEIYVPDEVEHIHRTRRDMMLAELRPLLEAYAGQLTAIDVASHQGWFSVQLAPHCRSVLGLEYQRRHVESAQLIARCLGVNNVSFVQENVESMPTGRYEPADIVINFGLMYNLENPIGVLRRCREMTKRVLLIEDTIVRSTTMKSLLRDLRERGGAREIHVRVACPPIIAPCFYGIDMSTVRELFAPKFMHGDRITVEEQEAMAEELEADSLFYLPLEAVSRCIGLDAGRLCRACITGEYPTATGEHLYQLALTNLSGPGRTYERAALVGAGEGKG